MNRWDTVRLSGSRVLPVDGRRTERVARFFERIRWSWRGSRCVVHSRGSGMRRWEQVNFGGNSRYRLLIVRDGWDADPSSFVIRARWLRGLFNTVREIARTVARDTRVDGDPHLDDQLLVVPISLGVGLQRLGSCMRMVFNSANRRLSSAECGLGVSRRIQDSGDRCSARNCGASN